MLPCVAEYPDWPRIATSATRSTLDHLPPPTTQTPRYVNDLRMGLLVHTIIREEGTYLDEKKYIVLAINIIWPILFYMKIQIILKCTF